MTKRTDEMKKSGLQLNACIHTMRGQEVTLKDLLPGFIVADKGGVVRLAELQSQGYVYLRPCSVTRDNYGASSIRRAELGQERRQPRHVARGYERRSREAR